jgi:hypothetical protein
MSTQVTGQNRTFKAGADLSAKQYFIVKQDTVQETVVLASAATDVLVGVLQNKPKSGENAEVCLRSAGGTSKIKLGGTVSAGDHLTADSNGKAVATTTGADEVIGRALFDGVDGDVIEFTPANYKYRTS